MLLFIDYQLLTEIKELVNKCTFTGGSYNGVSGNYVTGPNGKSIFLPFAGGRHYNNIFNEDSSGYFWSGTYDEYDGACCLYYSSGACDWDGDDLEYGYSVRPVKDK